MENTGLCKNQSNTLLDTIENAISLAGYKVLDGDRNSLIVRRISASDIDSDFEIKINEFI